MRKVQWILGALCIALAATVLMLWNQLREQDAKIARLRTQENALPATPILESSPESCRMESAGRVGRDPAAEPLAVTAPEVDDQIQNDPKFQEAMIEYQRVELGQSYAALFGSLRLSPEQADRVTRILAKQWVRGAHGIPAEYTREQWRLKNESELRAVLTQAQIDVLRHYRETAATREQVQSLRNELMVTQEPLRDDQIAPLVDALHTAEMQLLGETRDFNEALDKSESALAESERRSQKYFIEREAEAAKSKLEAAAAILSRDQLKALERQLKAQQALSQAGSKLRGLERGLATPKVP
jgi:hypothetical protein